MAVVAGSTDVVAGVLFRQDAGLNMLGIHALHPAVALGPLMIYSTTKTCNDLGPPAHYRY